MADQKFTELPQVVSATLADIYCAVQGGVSVQLTTKQLSDLFKEGFIVNFAGNPNGNLAGVVDQLCYDTANNDLYICTTTGTIATAVWTRITQELVQPINGGTGVSSPGVNTLPVANNASAFTFIGPLLDGELLIGATGITPVPTTITAGTNISVTNGPGSITIDGIAGGTFGWTEITGTSHLLTPDAGFIINNALQVSLTLPVIAALGSRISIIGKGVGGWAILQGASQFINVGINATTTGVGGSVITSSPFDSIDLICITANTEWSCISGPQGNLTIA